MTTTPTGRLLSTPDGRDLELTRTFRAPIDDVWASITESARTARWFGPWEGEGGAGRTIKMQLAFEDGAPWCDAHIDACEPPHHLALTTRDEFGTWRLEASLTETAGVTELRLIHHLDPQAAIAEVGPGWEYYLDALAAAREDRPHPDFDDYYPALKQYYADLEK
ncbi:SRPBCC family protein [Nocardia sp. CDC159]|uniref:SRPBCC family protein n=1 Tax=Nocardia pulmonis TaxID=2951408 RepID=A0A9X2EAB4_9NOCA|nr:MULTISPECIES: SRPBCC family protein [Nocardia]MCM6776674.1 SRPBCC family protein [Nocardia pulmonis]MCM6789177.1 SRPBCC family protein [Nocardia sp. CDC159]